MSRLWHKAGPGVAGGLLSDKPVDVGRLPNATLEPVGTGGPAPDDLAPVHLELLLDDRQVGKGIARLHLVIEPSLQCSTTGLALLCEGQSLAEVGNSCSSIAPVSFLGSMALSPQMVHCSPLQQRGACSSVRLAAVPQMIVSCQTRVLLMQKQRAVSSLHTVFQSWPPPSCMLSAPQTSVRHTDRSNGCLHSCWHAESNMPTPQQPRIA